MPEESKKQRDDRWYYSFLPYNVAGGATNPLIPLFVTDGLGGTVAQVGVVSAITSAASVPANIIWGNLSDTTKRRKVFVLIGFFGLALALFMMGVSSSVNSYYVANFVQGAIAAAVAPVGTVLILESFAKEEWARRIGDFSRVGGIGWVGGLLLGTVWLSMSSASDPASEVMAMRALFVVSSAMAVLSIIMALKWVPESKKKIDREDLPAASRFPLLTFERGRYAPSKILHVVRLSAKNLRPRNFPKNLKVYYVMVFLAWTGFLTFYVGLPIFLSSQVGLSVPEVFIVYIASSIASALVYSRAGRWTTKVGGKRIQTIAFVGRIVLFPSFFLVTLVNLPLAAVLIICCALHALIGTCWAMLSVAGNHLVSNMAFCDFRTESLGMYNSIIGIGSIAGSLIGGIVAAAYGFQDTFVVAALFVAAGLILLLSLNVEKVECAEPKANE
ncbi:MAG TPA: MFS transporter [Methanomassiliicoccales archaeon]|jgi:MFS family permease|nr:MFS transporter [Methanomassiliicoccales archaeon]